MKALREELAGLMEMLGFTKWGIGGISGLHPLGDEFPLALSVALVYEPAPSPYNEEIFHRLKVRHSREFEQKFNRLVAFFVEHQVTHLVPGAQNREGEQTVFPHKAAATRAGLGWIGKNDLLVTPEYGPRVRLGTILFDAAIGFDTPVTESRCGECDACVRACPHGVINGLLWSAGESRNFRIDAAACSGKREKYIPTLGRRHSCGFCQLACPVGGGAPADIIEPFEERGINHFHEQGASHHDIERTVDQGT